jgi:hypothetical protein
LKIADVMEACSDADDDLFLERGWTLCNVLRSIHGFAERECPRRVAEIFPDPVVRMIRTSAHRIQSRSAPGENAESALDWIEEPSAPLNSRRGYCNVGGRIAPSAKNGECLRLLHGPDR